MTHAELIKNMEERIKEEEEEISKLLKSNKDKTEIGREIVKLSLSVARIKAMVNLMSIFPGADINDLHENFVDLAGGDGQVAIKYKYKNRISITKGNTDEVIAEQDDSGRWRSRLLISRNNLASELCISKFALELIEEAFHAGILSNITGTSR